MTRSSLHRLMMLAAIAGVLAFLQAITVCAQDGAVAVDTLRPRYGLFGHFNFNLHRADFRALPGVPSCCPRFEEGTGTGFSAGLLYEHPLSSTLLLSVRGGYSSEGATLLRTEETLVDREGETTRGEFEHTLDATIATAGIEPLIGFRPVDRLTLHLGVRAGAILSPSYAQKEVLTQPAVGTFAGTNSRMRNNNSGDLPDAGGFSAGLVGGISYELPLNRKGTLLLAPEAFYTYGLTPVVKNIEWNIDVARAGIAIKYSPLPPGYDIEPPVIEPPRRAPALNASIVANGVTDDGREERKLTLHVEEFLATRLRPLLNYVFFAEGSSELPERYRRLTPDATAGFQIEGLYDEETLPTYYHLLNIVGRRMLRHPQATVTIVGCNDGAEGTRHGPELSKNCAVVVRDYLRDVWKIDEARMQLESRDLPEKPSNVNDPDGVIENRRVEIHSTTWEIIEPVLTRDTLRTTDPPVIRFRPDVHAEAGIARWNLKVLQNGAPLREFNGADSVPELVDWRLDLDRRRIAQGGEGIEYRFEAVDVAGQRSPAVTGLIPVELITVQKKRSQQIADKEIDRFSLILFDFNTAGLNEPNRRIVELVKGFIRPASTVVVTGYTDRMGNDAYNQSLSESRAKMTAKAFGREPVVVSGAGETQPIYDNDLPEGRFYNRTVEVVVETPVGGKE